MSSCFSLFLLALLFFIVYYHFENYLTGCVYIMTFAENLRYFREYAKLNQKELAEKVGIPFQTYNNYETKGNEPKIEVLIKLANALGIDVNTLVGFEPDDRALLLHVLRSADIAFELDPDDNNALYIENTYFTDSVYPKPGRMEGAAHLTFDDLKHIIELTKAEVLNSTYPIFKRFFHDRLTVFKFTSDYDPKDKTVWKSWVTEVKKADIEL